MLGDRPPAPSNYLLLRFGVCDSALAAAVLADLLDFELPSTFAAAVAAFEPVCRELRAMISPWVWVLALTHPKRHTVGSYTVTVPVLVLVPTAPFALSRGAFVVEGGIRLADGLHRCDSAPSPQGEHLPTTQASSLSTPCGMALALPK